MMYLAPSYTAYLRQYGHFKLMQPVKLTSEILAFKDLKFLTETRALFALTGHLI